MRPVLTRLLLLLGLFSCNYDPSEGDFTNIPQPSLEGITINLNDYPQEEIFLKQRTTFHYIIETGNKELIESRALLGDQIVWITSLKDGSFTLDPADLATGVYTLKIEFTAKTHSGSLAEKIGAEVLYGWTQRRIVVDRTIPEKPSDPGAIKITSVENIDNSVTIRWNQYPSLNFEKYELIREDYSSSGVINGGRVFTAVTDASTTALTDRQYIGGKSIYKLKLYAAGQVYTTPEYVYEHTFKPDIVYTISSNGSVNIKWNSLSKLKNNFNAYTLEVRELVGGYYQTVTFQKQSVTDTTVAFTPANFKFGKTREIRLTLTTTFDPDYKRIHSKTMSYGQPFVFFDPYNLEPRFDEGSGNYYLLINGYLHKISKSGEKIDSLNRLYSFIRLNNTMGVGSKDYKNYKINLSTMEEEGLINIPDGTILSVSDDNKFMVFTPFDGGKIFSSAGDVLLSFGFPNANKMLISPSGKYAFAQKYYKFNGTTFDEGGFWSSSNLKGMSFLPGQPDKLILSTTDRVGRFNMETMTYDVLSFNYHGPCNYDAVSDKIGCLMDEQFVILNAADMSPYKTLPVDSQNNYTLLNETVICPGWQIKLSDIP